MADELTILKHAKTYIDKMADGINPLTNASVSKTDLINNDRISLCLQYVSGVLQQVINQGGIEAIKPMQERPSLLQNNTSTEIQNSNSYTENLLYAVMKTNRKETPDILSPFPADIDDRVSACLNLLGPRNAEILKLRYRDGKTLQAISCVYGITRERVRQIIESSLQQLRYKSRREYLKGERESLPRSKNKSRSADVGENRINSGKGELFPLSTAPISLTEIINRINEFVEQRSLNYSIMITWLMDHGYIEKYSNDSGREKKRPTQKGTELGILTENRTGKDGGYTAILYKRSAQQYIMDNLDTIIEHNKK